MLSDSDSDANDDLHTITINQHFAKAFDYKKEREELAKLKEKYGSDYSGSGDSDDDSDDSEDTEEDSDGEELTPAVDAAILRTLALIKKKDPAIYEDRKLVFEEEHTRTRNKAPATKPKQKEKSKPFTIREAALASALAEPDSHSRSPSVEPRPLTHTEEQVLLRSETRAAFHGAIDSDTQGDDDDLLIPRSRTRDEVELEEEEYKTFLEREVGEDIRHLVTVDTNECPGTSEAVEIIGDGDKRLKGKQKKNGKREREEETEQRDKKSKEEADQEFLMNYIFDRGWIDRSNRRVPTYHEIIESSLKRSMYKPTTSEAALNNDDDLELNPDDGNDATLSDENSFDDLVDAFESSYNFRYEEPDGTLISSFPRNIQSARRESTTRKVARSRKKQRKAAEKQALLEARRAEIRRERALVEAAIDEEALAHLDLDSDWDPTQHDAYMVKLYGGDDEIVDDGDAEKPVWDDDINVDDGAGWKGTEEERIRKVDAYMDEVVNRLGFSGITSHMPTRFQYTSTNPENFGLTPVEILLATDAELNSYVGLKKLAPYRIDKGGKAKKSWDPKRVERLKEFRASLCSRVTSTYEGPWSLQVGANKKSRGEKGETQKRKGKKERARLKAMQGRHEEENDGKDSDVADKSQKRKRDPDVGSHSSASHPGETEADVGHDAGRKRRRRRHKKGSGAGEEMGVIAAS